MPLRGATFVRPDPPVSGRRPRILLVPGFVADTYCEIERSYVDLSAAASAVEFIWLVPQMRSSYDNFANPQNQGVLREPMYVPYLRERGISYVVAHVSRYNVFANAWRFWRVFRAHSIDAVYTHFGYERYWATFFGKVYGRVTIWNEHWYSLGMRHAAFKRRFYRLFVDRFIAVSAFLASTLPDSARVHTIKNGIWPALPDPCTSTERAARRRALGISEGVKVVLMVAAFTPQKRHDAALEICQLVLEQCTDTVFVFLGDGPQRRAFLERVKALRLDDRIRAPGYVHNVNDYYAVADAAMLTSREEGFGYAVLEAMRYGVPAVVFNSGAPAEVLRHEETGFVVPEGDTCAFAASLSVLLQEERLRTAVGERARRSAEVEYNREAWVRRVEAVLLSCVAPARTPISASRMKRAPPRNSSWNR